MNALIELKEKYAEDEARKADDEEAIDGFKKALKGKVAESIEEKLEQLKNGSSTAAPVDDLKAADPKQSGLLSNILPGKTSGPCRGSRSLADVNRLLDFLSEGYLL